MYNKYKKINIGYNKITISRKFIKECNQYQYVYEIKDLISSSYGGSSLPNCNITINGVKQIQYNTYESVLMAVFNKLNLPKETLREYKLKNLLNV